MPETTRRNFLKQSATVLGAAACCVGRPLPLLANPMGRPIGLQLYTVREQLGKDYDRVLARIAAIGYKEVETADLFDKTAAQIQWSLRKAGLICRSMHIWGPPQNLQQNFTRTMDYAKVLGAKYVVTSLIAPKRANFGSQAGTFDFSTMTADDYKSIADYYNKMGEQAHRSGLQLAYHNHNREFRPFKNGGNGYDELIRLTDPALLKLELDCGWMAAAGHDPAAYLRKYPNRYRMLHIKDFKLTGKPLFGEKGTPEPTPTELGRGSIDYRKIFAAAKNSGVEWYFVEQEPPFSDMPAMEAIKVDYDYLHHMTGV